MSSRKILVITSEQDAKSVDEALEGKTNSFFREVVYVKTIKKIYEKQYSKYLESFDLPKDITPPEIDIEINDEDEDEVLEIKGNKSLKQCGKSYQSYSEKYKKVFHFFDLDDGKDKKYNHKNSLKNIIHQNNLKDIIDLCDSNLEIEIFFAMHIIDSQKPLEKWLLTLQNNCNTKEDFTKYMKKNFSKKQVQLMLLNLENMTDIVKKLKIIIEMCKLLNDKKQLFLKEQTHPIYTNKYLFLEYMLKKIKLYTV